MVLLNDFNKPDLLVMDERELLVQVSRRLKEVREAKGISAYQLSIHSGINVSRIERCERNVSVSSIGTICSHLEISLSEFFQGIAVGKPN